MRHKIETRSGVRELKASTRVKSFGDGGAASNLVGVELGEVRRLD